MRELGVGSQILTNGDAAFQPLAGLMNFESLGGQFFSRSLHENLRRASTIQIQKSKRFSTVSLNSLARSYHRALRIAGRCGLDLLPIRDLGQSFNS